MENKTASVGGTVPAVVSSDLLAIPHALHWGWRNYGEAGIEVFGIIRIAGRSVTPNITDFASEEAAIKAEALKMRSRMAETLGCKPERINFINDGVCSQEPSLANARGEQQPPGQKT